MITYRPGLKPVYDGESAPAPKPSSKEAPLPSVKDAMVAATARDALLRAATSRTEIIGNPNPSPPLKQTPPASNPVVQAARRTPGSK